MTRPQPCPLSPWKQSSDGIGDLAECNALGIAQLGGTAPTAKSWKGLGPGVLEFVESHDGTAYQRRVHRSVRENGGRLPRVPESVIVRHTGGQRHVDLIAERLKAAARGSPRSTLASRNAERREPVTRGTRNGFEDFGSPDAAERQAKLRPSRRMSRSGDQRGFGRRSSLRY